MRYAWWGLALFLLPALSFAATCPTLSRGMSGSSVSAVQRFLFSAYQDFPSPTGFFGPTTELAVKQWQGEHGIEALGIVGPKTRIAMGLSCTANSSPTTTKPTTQLSTADKIAALRAQIAQLLALIAQLTGRATSTQAIPPSGGGGGGGGGGGTPPACTPLSPQTQVLACPTGQTGSITQSRTSSCPGPTWSPWTTSASTCTTPAGTASCILDSATVTHGASRTFFPASTVPYGQTCSGQLRTCTNGTLSGNATNNKASCAVAAASACTFNGSTVANAASVTAYQSATVSYGSQCVSEQRTCSNGTLSGSYVNAACTVAQTPPVTDIPTILNVAITDLVKNFWTGDAATGKITPTWDGIVGNPLHDSRGGIWQAGTLLNVLYGNYKLSPTDQNAVRIRAEWSYIKSVFNSSDFTACGANSSQLFGVDDVGWDAAALLQIYDVTGDETALAYAKAAITCSINRWGDQQFGGGLWYDDNRNEKSLIHIGLALEALRIFQLTNDQAYYQYAKQSYDWSESHLLRTDGLYWMDYYLSGPPIDRPNDIYKLGRTAAGSVTSIAGNMGMGIMQARLYKLTGEDVYRQRAIASAQAILTKLVDSNGVFIDDRDAWADGHFVREWMQEVLPLSSSLQQQGSNVIRQTAIAVYNKDRTSDGYYGGDWSGPVDATSPWAAAGFTPQQIMTSSNAVDYIVAAALVSAGQETGPKARDTQRKMDLQKLQYALGKYKTDHGAYPITNWWYSSEPGDYVTTNGGNYIPALAPAYIASLPRDSGGGLSPYPQCAPWKAAYLYASDGTSYKLLSNCSPEGTWSSSDGFYDPVRPATAWMVCVGASAACNSW